MSIILAVKDDQDIVMACDGRVLASDLSVMSDDTPKTLALNHNLCLGLGGPTDAMELVLRALGIKCAGAHPIDLLSECEEVYCPIDMEYCDARDELAKVLQWMLRRAPRSEHRSRVPVVLLAGTWSNSLGLCGYDYPTWLPDESPATGYSQAVLGRIPDSGSCELTEFHDLVRGQTTAKAESRLSCAVRFCARYFGASGPVNETVFLRRYSEGFQLTRADRGENNRRPPRRVQEP